jgi:hypothetical protein
VQNPSSVQLSSVPTFRIRLLRSVQLVDVTGVTEWAQARDVRHQR